MWIVASSQLTNSPSIQICFVGVIGMTAPRARMWLCEVSQTSAVAERGLTRDPRRESVTDLARRAYDAAALAEVRFNRGLDLARRLLVAEVVEQHGDREHRGGGVGLALAGDVRRAAVHRLEHARCGAVRVDVAAGGKADSTGYGRRQVGEDVTEHV